jgi:hypothetical protein
VKKSSEAAKAAQQARMSGVTDAQVLLVANGFSVLNLRYMHEDAIVVAAGLRPSWRSSDSELIAASEALARGGSS